MSDHGRSITCMACHGTGRDWRHVDAGIVSPSVQCEYCGGTGREVQQTLCVLPQAECVARPLEREYVTQEGDEIQLLANGLAIRRGGRVVEFIKYKETE